MLIRKGSTAAERVGTALASLSRSAFAMSMLRSRVEARVNSGTAVDINGDHNGEDLAKILQLVKDAQLLLKEIAVKAESARFLEEFIRIINSTAGPVGEIQGEMQELVPMAEAALSEMQQAISCVSKALSPASREEIDPSILAQASALTTGSSNELLAGTVPESGAQEKGKFSAAPEEKSEQLEEVAV